MHDELLPRIKDLLGLSAKASLPQVIDAQEAERRRQDDLASRVDKHVAWWTSDA